MATSKGKIIIPPDVNVWPHELATARILASAGYTIEFVRKSEVDHQTSADILLDGEIWEMKSPKGSSIKAVERNLRKAIVQSHRIIFDSHRMKCVPDGAIERELRTCCDKRIKGIDRLLFVNRHNEIIDIK